MYVTYSIALVLLVCSFVVIASYQSDSEQVFYPDDHYHKDIVENEEFSNNSISEVKHLHFNFFMVSNNYLFL